MERTSDAILKEIFLLPPRQHEQHEKLVQEYAQVSRAELESALNRLPFVISCAKCDVDSPDSYEQANALGWQDIQPDETGWSWNFLGMCPCCVAKEQEQAKLF
jgi:hypothetical protein